MGEVEVKILNYSQNGDPQYATEQAAGMDLQAAITEPVSLKPMERKLIPTGISIELPQGYEAQIRPRSGMAIRKGITCLNSPGTIDADYRGEIKVILINLSAETQVIEPGDRIAQMIVSEFKTVHWKKVKELGVTQRNEGGFGHTGK